jgi:hypothetical protein
VAYPGDKHICLADPIAKQVPGIAERHDEFPAGAIRCAPTTFGKFPERGYRGLQYAACPLASALALDG